MCECNKNEYTYEKIVEIRDYLTERCSIRPKVGLICGSGLGSLAESIEKPVAFNYKDIPNFPVSTISGHKGSLVFGYISGVPVICMQGRFHYYEGYSLSKCVIPVRLMKLLGVGHLIASNAAGSTNSKFKVGDIMLIKDHYNIMGLSGIGPLIGLNDERFGPQFFSMVNAYDPVILQDVMAFAKSLGMQDFIRQGVYTCAGGPNYETIAEVKGLVTLGVDAIGMSTVHEIIAARHCGIKCFAFSLITNVCMTEYPQIHAKTANGQDASQSEADHDEVLAAGKANEERCRTFVQKVVEYIGQTL